MARAGDGLGVVVDAASPEKGGGQIWLVGPPGGFDGVPSLLDFISWEAPSWQESGVCPLGWTVIPPMTPDDGHTLVLFCAPQVRVISDYQGPADCSGCHYPPWWEKFFERIKVEIIRVLSPGEVPQPGDRADYAAYLTTRYVDRANVPVDDPAAVVDKRSLISITRTPLGVRLACGRDDWAVSVEATNGFEPSLVDFSLTCSMPKQSYSLSQADIVLARTSNTKVTGFQRYADQTNEIATFHQVSVWDETVMSRAPECATASPVRRVAPVAITGKPMFLTAMIELGPTAVYLVFSMVPLIGEGLDIAELISIKFRKKDLLGNAAGDFDMALTAASLFTGAIMEGPENARRIGKALEKVSPVRFLDGTGAVSLAIRREIGDQISPLQRTATRQLSSGDETTIARAVETAVSSRNIDALDDIVQASIRETMDRLAAGPGLPAPLFADTMRGIHPSELAEEFASLSDDAARELLDSYRRGAADAFDFDIGAMARADAAFWAKYAPAVDEAAVFKLLTPLGDDFVHPLLRSGFRDYKAGGGGKTAVEWLASQSGRSRYRRVLVDALGSDANRIVAQVMGRSVRRRGYRPTAQQIDDGVRAMEALEASRKGALLDVLPYGDAAAMQRGFGHLLERDHLLEGRFWRHYIDGAIDYQDFWCVFAPKNAYVRAELAKRGWAHFDYDHLSKTQAMKNLIPHGKEDVFTTAEIYMAHWLALVDVHADAATRLRAADRLDAVIVPMLEEMATSKGEGIFLKPAMAAPQMIATLAARRATL